MTFILQNNPISVLFYTLILVSGNLFAQKSMDNLSKYSYIELDDLIHSTKKDSIKNTFFLNYYFQKASKEKNNKELAHYYKNYLFYQKEEIRLNIIDSALHFANKTNDKSLIGDVLLVKSTLYYSLKDYQKTLDNCLKAYGYISQTDDTYKKYRIKYNIGIIKNYLGYYDDAENLFKECINYFGNDKKSYNMHRGYVNSLEGLAWTYTKTNRVNKSDEILQKALISIQNTGFSELDSHYITFKQGINNYFLNNYEQAIETIEKELPFLYENEDFAWATIGAFYIGKSYWDKNQQEKAIIYFEKINEVFNKQTYTHPDLRESYELLINYYKKQGIKTKQLYYIEQLFKVDDAYNQNYKYLIRQVHKEYETKDLLNTKKELEASLYFQEYKTIIISVIALLLAIILIMYTLRQKKQKKVAQKLIKEIEELKQQNAIHYKSAKTIQKPLQINDKTIQKLLENFENFEKKKHFLKPISLEKLARELKTNPTYLSTIINTYKNKSFTEYTNDLRIEFFLTEITNNCNSDFFRYSLDGIAKDLGFNSTVSFTRAFKKQTKVSPSIFVKELSKNNIPAA